MLNLYEIDEFYYNLVADMDSNVLKLKDEGFDRIFVGIVVTHNLCDFFIPLSSYKDKKHGKMKNMEDFHAYKKGNGKGVFVLNFNCMIPVPTKCYSLKNINAETDVAYQRLLQLEYRMLKGDATNILTKARNLIDEYMSNRLRSNVRNRCVDFNELIAFSNNY